MKLRFRIEMPPVTSEQLEKICCILDQEVSIIGMEVRRPEPRKPRNKIRKKRNAVPVYLNRDSFEFNSKGTRDQKLVGQMLKARQALSQLEAAKKSPWTRAEINSWIKQRCPEIAPTGVSTIVTKLIRNGYLAKVNG